MLSILSKSGLEIVPLNKKVVSFILRYVFLLETEMLSSMSTISYMISFLISWRTPSTLYFQFLLWEKFNRYMLPSLSLFFNFKHNEPDKSVLCTVTMINIRSGCFRGHAISSWWALVMVLLTERPPVCSVVHLIDKRVESNRTVSYCYRVSTTHYLYSNSFLAFHQKSLCWL